MYVTATLLPITMSFYPNFRLGSAGREEGMGNLNSIRGFVLGGVNSHF